MTPWEQLGLAIGHATDHDGATGCSVIRGISAPFRCSAALLGRASGTRELATCDADHLVDRTDAFLRTGGSAYGLDAAAGVMRWMEERGRGFPVGGGVVPIVPTAVIFDLAPLGRFEARPTADMAYVACDQASATLIAEGSVGAGAGALVGKAVGPSAAMKGGVGIGVGIGVAESGGELAAAFAVVNAFGDVRDDEGRIIAGARDGREGFLDAVRSLRGQDAPAAFALMASVRRNTTLVSVAVSTPLTKAQLSPLARVTTAARHHRITRCGTSFDGDVLFAASRLNTIPGFAAADELPLARIEAVAGAAVERDRARCGDRTRSRWHSRRGRHPRLIR
ncbi:P1 family peptidase, partial [Gemmatimonas sp.]